MNLANMCQNKSNQIKTSSRIQLVLTLRDSICWGFQALMSRKRGRRHQDAPEDFTPPTPLTRGSRAKTNQRPPNARAFRILQAQAR